MKCFTFPTLIASYRIWLGVVCVCIAVKNGLAPYEGKPRTIILRICITYLKISWTADNRIMRNGLKTRGWSCLLVLMLAHHDTWSKQQNICSMWLSIMVSRRTYSNLKYLYYVIGSISYVCHKNNMLKVTSNSIENAGVTATKAFHTQTLNSTQPDWRQSCAKNEWENSFHWF